MTPAAQCHVPGATALVKLHGGYPARWFNAVVTQAAPLTVRINEPEDKVWHGCEVTKADGRILVSEWHKRKVLMQKHERVA